MLFLNPHNIPHSTTETKLFYYYFRMVPAAIDCSISQHLSLQHEETDAKTAYFTCRPFTPSSSNVVADSAK